MGLGESVTLRAAGLLALGLGAALCAGSCGSTSSRRTVASSDECERNRDCSGGEVCNVETGRCVECVEDGDCDSGQRCSDHECVSASADGTGGASSGSGGNPGSGGDGSGTGGAEPVGICGDGVVDDGETCDGSPVTCASCERVLAPLIWLDAADSETLVINDTGVVTDWQDKSGRGHHMRAVGTAGPQVGTQVNDQDTVVFSGADSMTVPGTETTMQGDFAAFVVVSINGADSHHTIFGKAADAFGNNDTSLDWAIAADVDNTFRVLVTQNSGGLTTRAISPPFSVQRTYVLAATWSGGDTLRAYSDGEIFQEVVAPVALGDGHPLCLGGYDPAHQERWLEGNVAEAIAYTEALDDAPLAAIQQYLMEKWQ